MNTPETQNQNFEYFTDPEHRSMIVECGFRIAEHMIEDDIGSLVLVDKAARNAYIPVRSALKQIDPENRQDVFFLNPHGFISPYIHDVSHYGSRLIQGVIEETGKTHDQASSEIMATYLSRRQARASIRREQTTDMIVNKRRDIAQRLTPLFYETAVNSKGFNGRILVLDACSHTGGSVNGIVAALRDIKAAEVQVGTVDNSRSEKEHMPDFLVFEDNEVLDMCKPFGPQKGILKGTGEQLVSGVAPEGLSNLSKTARRELHKMMQNSSELREQYVKDAQQRKIQNEIFSSLYGIIGQLFHGRAEPEDVINLTDDTKPLAINPISSPCL